MPRGKKREEFLNFIRGVFCLWCTRDDARRKKKKKKKKKKKTFRKNEKKKQRDG